MSIRREFEHEGENLLVQTEAVGDGVYRVQVGDSAYEVAAVKLPDGRVRFELEGQVYTAAAAPRGAGDASRRKDVYVSLGSSTWLLRAAAAGGRARGDAAGADGVIVAPMTGTVLKINVAEGDTVAAADTVAVVSAMKMEHKLAAGVDGTVAEVAVTVGATVDQDELLIRIDVAAAESS